MQILRLIRVHIGWTSSWRGRIAATKKHGAYEIQQFCRNPNLTIELAFASSEALKGLTTAQANLSCVGNKLTLEALTRADNDIETISANSIVMPELRTVGGTQSFYDAELVHQPRLERIDGSNYGTRVRKIYQPHVTYVGGINRFICVKEMVQPPLEGKRPCFVEWPPEVYGYPM